MPQLAQQAAQIVRRDVMPGFVAAELLVWLKGLYAGTPRWAWHQPERVDAMEAVNTR